MMDIDAIRVRDHVRLDDPDRGQIVSVMLVAGGGKIGVQTPTGPTFVAAARLHPIVVKRPARPKPAAPPPTGPVHVHVWAITVDETGMNNVHRCACGASRVYPRFAAAHPSGFSDPTRSSRGGQAFAQTARRSKAKEGGRG